MDRASHEVKAITKSLRVIEALQELDGGRVTEIADHVGMAKSTAQHLTTLERSGHLERDGDTYHVGLRFLNLGEYARSRWPAVELIKESISELSRRTDEEIDFVAEDHGRVLTVFESYHKWVKYDSGDEREADGALPSPDRHLLLQPRDRLGEGDPDEVPSRPSRAHPRPVGSPPEDGEHDHRPRDAVRGTGTHRPTGVRRRRRGVHVGAAERRKGRDRPRRRRRRRAERLGAHLPHERLRPRRGDPRTLADVVADLEADIAAADAY